MRLFSAKDDIPATKDTHQLLINSIRHTRILLSGTETIVVSISSAFGAIIIAVIAFYIWRKFLNPEKPSIEADEENQEGINKDEEVDNIDENQKNDKKENDQNSKEEKKEKENGEYDAKSGMDRLRWEEHKRYQKLRFIGNSDFICWQLIKKVKVVEGISDDVKSLKKPEQPVENQNSEQKNNSQMKNQSEVKPQQKYLPRLIEPGQQSQNDIGGTTKINQQDFYKYRTNETKVDFVQQGNSQRSNRINFDESEKNNAGYNQQDYSNRDNERTYKDDLFDTPQGHKYNGNKNRSGQETNQKTINGIEQSGKQTDNDS